MEPKRVFVEKIRVVEITSSPKHSTRSKYTGTLEFADGDRYPFETDERLQENHWLKAAGIFEETLRGPTAFIEEVIEDRNQQTDD